MNARKPIVFLALAALASSAVVAAEGRIPIWQPVTISSPGKYFVSRNVAGPSVVIDVQASDVEIDLNGMRLETTGSNAVIRASSVDGVVVRNGTVVGGLSGIRFEESRQIVVEDVRCESSGVGIRLVDSTHFALRRNLVQFADERGIDVQSVDAATGHGVLERNIVQASVNGIRVQSGLGVLLDRNTIQSSTFAGLEIVSSTGTLVVQNIVESANTDDGIVLQGSSRNKLYNNVVSLSAAHGIRLDAGSSDNLVLDNSSSGNGGEGLRIEGDRNHVEGNVLNSNASFGLRFTSSAQDNIYRRNTGLGDNTSGGVCLFGPASTGRCDDDGANNNNQSHGDNFMPGPL